MFARRLLAYERWESESLLPAISLDRRGTPSKRWSSEPTPSSSRRTSGFEKPSRGFFEKVAEAAGARPDDVLYVGDRLDNDVLPAKSVGMQAALIRRGPWGYLHAEWPQASQADAIINSLAEIPRPPSV